MPITHRKWQQAAAVFAVALLLTSTVRAQQFHSATLSCNPVINMPEFASTVLKEIQDIEDRTVAIAQDFPDDLYNTYRPKGNQDVRTAAEILLHIVGVNNRMGFVLSTKEQKDAVFAAGKVPGIANFPYVSKQDTIAKVKQSFAAVRKAIEDNPDPKNLDGWLYVIAHSNGHFGNLVTYYRNNGLVPPTSRQ